jgi:hypothetical protein
MHVTDLLAPLATRWARRVREELDVLPHPTDGNRQFVAGPDPDRVLVLGDGPAIGFGVLTQELALPGQLARRLGKQTGRGVVVDVRSRHGITAAAAPGLLGAARMDHYDAVLVCVGSTDAYNLLSEERWRTDLAQLTDALRAATTPSTIIAVLAIRPLQRPNAAQGRAGGLVEDHASRLDRIAEDVCMRRPGVLHLRAATGLAEAPRSASAHECLADLIAVPLARELDRLAGRVAPATARTLRSRPDPEEERQRALQRSGLVGTGSNARLDRLLSTAKELFATTGAAVTLVDGDRVVVKASAGLPTDDVPRSIAPCDRTIRQNGALVLGDLREEPISRDGWRFYAGHPLESPDGYRIGALCVLDTRPHEPLTLDRAALAQVAARIESELWDEVARTPRAEGPADRPDSRRSGDAPMTRLAAT